MKKILNHILSLITFMTIMSLFVHATPVEIDGFEIDLDLINSNAEKGDMSAMVLLAGLYFYDEPEKSVFYFSEMSKLGFDNATINLARCYASGTGVAKDENKAIEILLKLANKGNTYAIEELAQIYSLNDDYENENLWLLKGIENKDNDNNKSHWLLGLNYAIGRGVAKDKNKAFEIYKMGVEKRYDYNVFSSLGNCYFYGEVAEKNLKESLYWNMLAQLDTKTGSPEIIAEIKKELSSDVVSEIEKAVQKKYKERKLDILNAEIAEQIKDIYCGFDLSGLSLAQSYLRLTEPNYYEAYIWNNISAKAGMSLNKAATANLKSKLTVEELKSADIEIEKRLAEIKKAKSK